MFTFPVVRLLTKNRLRAAAMFMLYKNLLNTNYIIFLLENVLPHFWIVL
jgi:hypothetical protein